MDQIRIGKFIAECRKKENLTQAQLAEKLNITDRAISKWETGKALPDSNIMLELCDILGISVNELLSGERIDVKQKEEKTNELVFQMAKNEERYHKRLMFAACVIVVTSLIALVCLITLISLLIPECGFQKFLVIVSVILFVIPCLIALKFEAETGYYECKNCHHMFVPSYKEVTWVLHTPTKRLVKCPQCGKWTWCKKVTEK